MVRPLASLTETILDESGNATATRSRDRSGACIQCQRQREQAGQKLQVRIQPRDERLAKATGASAFSPKFLSHVGEHYIERLTYHVPLRPTNATV
jgi:hypothetical protein